MWPFLSRKPLVALFKNSHVVPSLSCVHIYLLSSDQQMIKNMLKRRKESDTYLATSYRHRWSAQMTMKKDNLLEPALWLSSAGEEESGYGFSEWPENTLKYFQSLIFTIAHAPTDIELLERADSRENTIWKSSVGNPAKFAKIVVLQQISYIVLMSDRKKLSYIF